VNDSYSETGEAESQRYSIDLLLLTCAAGLLDALSYLRAGVFTANMTGNTVVLGLALFGPDRSKVLPATVALFCFALGALSAGAILLWLNPDNDRRRDLTVGLGWELVFLTTFALLSITGNSDPSISPLVPAATAAVALGAQSVAVRKLRISGVVTTFMTGTITTAAMSVVGNDREAAQHNGGEHSSPRLLVAMLGCYVLAAALGAALRKQVIIVSVLPLVLVATVEIRWWIVNRTGHLPGNGSQPRVR